MPLATHLRSAWLPAPLPEQEPDTADLIFPSFYSAITGRALRGAPVVLTGCRRRSRFPVSRVSTPRRRICRNRYADPAESIPVTDRTACKRSSPDGTRATSAQTRPALAAACRHATVTACREIPNPLRNLPRRTRPLTGLDTSYALAWIYDSLARNRGATINVPAKVVYAQETYPASTFRVAPRLRARELYIHARA